MRSYSIVMTDHPGWVPGRAGSLMRVTAPSGQQPAVASTDGCQLAWCCPDAASRPGPAVFTLPGSAVPDVPGLASALSALGPVARLPNPDLWDALGTAIIRQVVRAGQARRLYRAFCAAYGTAVQCGTAAGWLFPAPQTVLALREAQFSAVGLAFKRRALQSAAAAFLDHGATWAALPAADLVRELQEVHRVGPWTAGAAAADWANDFSVYPCGDLAVRTWAARAVPAAAWPGDEPGFQRHWQQLAGPHLAELTLLTLAWGGNHARTSTPVPADRGRQPVPAS
jgi:DNA-3-methyladenine glycosylase II